MLISHMSSPTNTRSQSTFVLLGLDLGLGLLVFGGALSGERSRSGNRGRLVGAAGASAGAYADGEGDGGDGGEAGVCVECGHCCGDRCGS